jgi:hypothetical protein
MRIESDDLTGQPVPALLQEHLSNMYELSPPTPGEIRTACSWNWCSE